MNAMNTLPASLTGCKYAVLCGRPDGEYTVYSFKTEARALAKFTEYTSQRGRDLDTGEECELQAVFWSNGQATFNIA